MLTVIPVSGNPSEIQSVQTLFKEYAEELNENLCFQSFDQELKDPLQIYKAPNGSIFLAFIDGEPVGCIALKPLYQEGVCEMKRLYVKPAYRKLGVADRLVKVLVEDSINKGYNKMVLDTLERLQPAIRLYARQGFQHTSAYYQNPLPGVVFMEKTL